MALLVFFLFLALGISFICSILEAVILSITPSYIATERKNGSKRGTQLELIKTDIDRFLAAILSLNTIAHTIGAAGVGAQASVVFGEAYFGVISAVLTLLILVFSEIIPKTLGANYWRELTPICLKVLRVIEISMLPLVFLSQLITRFLAKGDEDHTVKRNEIAALAWAGEEEGILSQEESKVIHSIIELRSITAKDIMTPRTVIHSLSDHLSCREALIQEKDLPFSRIPIYDGDPEKIHAFIRKDELLSHLAHGDTEVILKDIARPVLSVPSSKRLLELLRDMSIEHFQVAIVVSEYGDIKGMVTMEDLVETMLGLEIVDETDRHPDMQQLARTLWERRAGKTNQQMK